MAEYMNKEVFLSSMGLIGDETKYGNRDAEHQSRSYSKYMSYEIMDGVEDSIVEEELEPVKHGRCKLIGADKRGRGGVWECAGRDGCGKIYPYKCDFCPNCGARMDEEGTHER